MTFSVYTGIQPSGKLHIGNYLGAVKPTLELLEKHNSSMVFVADLHALTSLQDKKALKEYTKELLLTWLACGLDPEKTTLFRQSDIAMHCELMWILTTICPMGLLERAHSYKDKVAKGLDASVGLFSYPVLMAADILLYQPQYVPVGKDQKQHLEIARDLAQKFNHTYGETFLLPEAVISEETGVIPGTDGQKMSKSYNNTIPLFDSEKNLKKAIMGIVTDSTPVEEPKNPETCNVFALAKLFLSASDLKSLEDKYKKGGMGYGEAKTILFEAVNTHIEPMRQKRAQLENEEGLLEKILEKGRETAGKAAFKTMQKVKKRVGLL